MPDTFNSELKILKNAKCFFFVYRLVFYQFNTFFLCHRWVVAYDELWNQSGIHMQATQRWNWNRHCDPYCPCAWLLPFRILWLWYYLNFLRNVFEMVYLGPFQLLKLSANVTFSVGLVELVFVV